MVIPLPGQGLTTKAAEPLAVEGDSICACSKLSPTPCNGAHSLHKSAALMLLCGLASKDLLKVVVCTDIGRSRGLLSFTWCPASLTPW